MERKVRIVLVGTGGMGSVQADFFRKIDGCEVVAACDVDSSRLAEFAEKHKIAAVYTDFDKLLEEVDFEAVTIVTPDRYHFPVAMKAISAGKHILCEKPLATNKEDAFQMRDAAREAGLINMVNLSYRNSSAIQKAAQLVEEGVLGTVRHIHAHYHQSWLVQDDWGDWKTSPSWLWRLSTGHGSAGVLGDIGIHILDFASFPIGSYESVNCKLKTFDKAPGNQIGEYVLDANDSAIITAEFSNGAIGAIHTTRWAYPHRNSLRLNLYGDKASIEVDLDRSETSLSINYNGKGTLDDWETMDCGETPNNYERFITSIRTGINQPADFARGAEIQAVLDACHESAATDKTVHL